MMNPNSIFTQLATQLRYVFRRVFFATLLHRCLRSQEFNEVSLFGGHWKTLLTFHTTCFLHYNYPEDKDNNTFRHVERFLKYKSLQQQSWH
jgi:hypothetical protein